MRDWAAPSLNPGLPLTRALEAGNDVEIKNVTYSQSFFVLFTVTINTGATLRLQTKGMMLKVAGVI
jgi:hypothetical protein